MVILVICIYNYLPQLSFHKLLFQPYVYETINSIWKWKILLLTKKDYYKIRIFGKYILLILKQGRESFLKFLLLYGKAVEEALERERERETKISR